MSKGFFINFVFLFREIINNNNVRGGGGEISGIFIFYFFYFLVNEEGGSFLFCGWTAPLVQTPREVLFLSFNP
jgi:hypothetical protein